MLTNTLVKQKLKENNLTSQWLLANLAKMGVHSDKTQLSKAINGVSKKGKSLILVRDSLRLLDIYEQNFTNMIGENDDK